MTICMTCKLWLQTSTLLLRLGKSEMKKAISAIVLDKKFWDDCLLMVKIVTPIIRLLRIVDADEKPLLGYVYEGLQRVKKAIKEMHSNKK